MQISGLWKAEGCRLLSVHVNVCCYNRALASVQQLKEIYSDIKIKPPLSLTHTHTQKHIRTLKPREQTDVMLTQSLKSTHGNTENRIREKRQGVMRVLRQRKQDEVDRRWWNLTFWVCYIAVRSHTADLTRQDTHPSTLLNCVKRDRCAWWSLVLQSWGKQSSNQPHEPSSMGCKMQICATLEINLVLSLSRKIPIIVGNSIS